MHYRSSTAEGALAAKTAWVATTVTLTTLASSHAMEEKDLPDAMWPVLITARIRAAEQKPRRRVRNQPVPTDVTLASWDLTARPVARVQNAKETDATSTTENAQVGA